MRKYLLSLLIIICCTNAYGYRSVFGNNSTYWVFRWYQAWGISVDTVFADGDTIACGLSYKKLRISSQIPSNYVGLIREDTLTGKVWYKSMTYLSNYPADDTMEILAFDFSLQKGDTFDTWNVNYGLPRTIDDSLKIVDSVYYKNGFKHIIFKPIGDAGIFKEPLLFLEGVGSSFGILFKEFHTACFFNYLLCSYKDGIKTEYSNVLYNGDCTAYLNIEHNYMQEQSVTIYPVPAINELYVEDNMHIVRVCITDMAGSNCITQLNPGKKIDISGLNSGYYLIKIDYSDNKSIYKRFSICR